MVSCRTPRWDAAGVGGHDRAVGAGGAAQLAETYRGSWIYEPGTVFADLAAVVADGADCIDAVEQRCGDREHVFGPPPRGPPCRNAGVGATVQWRVDAASATTIVSAYFICELRYCYVDDDAGDP